VSKKVRRATIRVFNPATTTRPCGVEIEEHTAARDRRRGGRRGRPRAMHAVTYT